MRLNYLFSAAAALFGSGLLVTAETLPSKQAPKKLVPQRYEIETPRWLRSSIMEAAGISIHEDDKWKHVINPSDFSAYTFNKDAGAIYYTLPLEKDYAAEVEKKWVSEALDGWKTEGLDTKDLRVIGVSNLGDEKEIKLLKKVSGEKDKVFEAGLQYDFTQEANPKVWKKLERQSDAFRQMELAALAGGEFATDKIASVVIVGGVPHGIVDRDEDLSVRMVFAVGREEAPAGENKKSASKSGGWWDMFRRLRSSGA